MRKYQKSEQRKGVIAKFGKKPFYLNIIIFAPASFCPGILPRPKKSPARGSRARDRCKSYLFNRSNINDKPVPHVSLEHTGIGGCYILYIDHFDVRNDPMLRTKIQHLLGLGYPTGP